MQPESASAAATAVPITARGATSRRLRAGDRVVVRPAHEILATLDANGTVHGLPFMPEMLDWCGREYTVERRAEKVCVDIPLSVVPRAYGHRRFAHGDVVFLEGPRCLGQHHDGCKRSCKIFWNEAWLRRVDAAAAEAPTDPAAHDAARARLKTRADAERYFCQSTELYHATAEFPGRKKPWMLRVLWRELRQRDRGVIEIVKLAVLWLYFTVNRRVHGDDEWLAGPHERATPSVSLGLQPGDKVRFKSRDDVVATLNRSRRNRGMGYCAEMTRYCGGEAVVTGRFDRMIDERTGLMREVTNTVLLQDMRTKSRWLPDSECLCADVLGDCPRGEMMYWREIWLERAHDKAG